MTYTIVGVIGHIDHGKTSLVAALTGFDTDTHPEEKRRGITIDLGFASYKDGEHVFALVDAPGHQKYIGNLLAGVSGVDIGLLVVAADQGIQAQTLEHAAILSSLGVDKLIAVISRIDLADDQTRENLAEELDLFLADFGFIDVPTVAISTVTGSGLDQLKSLLVSHARTSQRTAASHFRMPIDRAFTIEGRGAVVAGTPWSGSVRVGDHLQVARTGQRIRVREIEVHGDQVLESELGMRTAMNIVGATDSLVRGDELVAESTHPVASRLIAEVKMFRDASEWRCPSTVHLHTATTAVTARVTGTKRIRGGESAIVLIDTETPIVSTYGQQCLFRKPYPIGSFAGARILGTIDTNDRRSSKALQLGHRLASPEAEDRFVGWVDYQGELAVDPQDLELRMAIAPEQQSQCIRSAVESGQIEMPVDGRLVSSARIKSIRRYLLKIMTHQAEATEQAWLDEAAVIQRAATTGTAAVIRCVLDRLVTEKELVRANKMVAIASEETLLSKKQRSRMEQILKGYDGARTPPTIKELATELQTTIDAVQSLVRFATQQGVLVDLGNGFLMDRRTLGDTFQKLKLLFDEKPEQTVAEIRDHLDITRKHAIPLLEYCDRVGVTVRDGDRRRAGDRLDIIIAEHHSEHD